MTARSKGVFVTGTDTGVGKTLVSAVVLRTLIRSGVKAGAMKPLETGCEEKAGTLIPADGSFLRHCAGMDDPLELVAPVRYRYPVAPMTAEALEGRPVELDRIRSAYGALSGKYPFLVVEGVGGLMVPITRTPSGSGPGPYFLHDLARELGLPLLIVARPSLGTLNHTLLTVHRALNDGLEIAGVVLNNSEPPEGTISENTNPGVLRELCPAPVIGPLAWLPRITLRDIDTLADVHGRELLELFPWVDL